MQIQQAALFRITTRIPASLGRKQGYKSLSAIVDVHYELINYSNFASKYQFKHFR